MALVERQKIAGPVTFGQNDDGRISKTDSEIVIPGNQLPRPPDILRVKLRELVRLALDLFEKAYLRAHTGHLHQETVDLSQDEGRENQWWRSHSKNGRGSFVMALRWRQRGDETAGVDQNHRPKPSRSSSTRSAIDGSSSS